MPSLRSYKINKVLIFASDIVPMEGMPTSGGGLRSWQVIQGLIAHGYNVIYSIPKNRYLLRKYTNAIHFDLLQNAWTPDNQDEIVGRFNPDAIIFMNPDVNYLKRRYWIPLIADMHGPRLIEHELIFNEFSAIKRGELIREDLEAFRKVDLLVCAGERQRYYFTAWLLMAGYPISELDIAFMPVSLSPTLPTLERKDYGHPKLIFSGGFYPWQNPSIGLKTVADVLLDDGKGKLHIYGSGHNVNDSDTLFSEIKRKLRKNHRVRFRGYKTRNSLLEEFASGYVAIELMSRNMERELAFTTRTVEFLWVGLPVIYNNYSELTEYIRQYEAGWCVNPENPEEIKKAVRIALHEPAMVKAYAHNAQRLVAEKFTWDKTILPILDFLENPVLRRRFGGLAESPVSFVCRLPQSHQQPSPIGLRASRDLWGRISRFIDAVKRRKQTRTIRASGLVDAEWYLATYRDVRAAGIDPVYHYCNFGWKENRNPSPAFSTADYLARHPSLVFENVCPLHHVLLSKKEDK